MNSIQLAGGWGYDNLGDEVILASYLEFFRGSWRTAEDGIECLTVVPGKTRAAQRPSRVRFTGERVLVALGSGRRTEPLLLGGGGYLNGQWTPEVQLKLNRLSLLAGGRQVVVHGVELRRLSGGITGYLSRRLFRGAQVAVRDDESQIEAQRLGVDAVVLPDAVSLLYPHLDAYRCDVLEARGRVLLNLLDIGARGDSHEAEIDVESWGETCEELVERLGPRALGLVVGSGDRKYMSWFAGLELIEPSTVAELVGAIGSADALISVRMHPALTASMLEIPVVAVPYCGKVRPTMERIGVDEIVSSEQSVSAMFSRLDRTVTSREAWAAASAANSQWLKSALG